MKTCDVLQFYSPLSGGVKRYVHDKMRFMEARGGIAHVLIVPAERDEVYRLHGSTVYAIRSPRLIGSASYRALISRRRIEAVLEHERPDVIEVGDPYRSAWIAAAAARKAGIPILAYYHSDYPRALGRTIERFSGTLGRLAYERCLRPYLLKLYDQMDVTVVASQRYLDTLRAMGLRRLVRIPLGTDPSIFYPRPTREAVRAELGLDPDARLLLFVGRLGREKNLRDLIAMLRLLPPADRTHLLVVGDGELRRYVDAAAATRSDLTWFPHCHSPDRLADLYSAADLFVHPGTHETFGLVCLEAQACGCPVLVVRGGGAEETVARSPGGVVAASSDPHELARAVHEALGRDGRAGEREARHACVRAHWSCERTYEDLLRLYRHLLIQREAARDAAARGEILHELHRASV